MSNQYVQSLVFNIPERLRKALYLFQKDGVLEGIKRRGRILIADEMGLGKTIQIVALIAYLMEVVCVLECFMVEIARLSLHAPGITDDANF